jgi:uncharacterized protein with ATP-grasp and redox domains
MRTYLDCFPCFVRQALDAARFATDDEQVHARVVQEVFRLAARMDTHQPPPVIGQQIHRLIRRVTGKEDPYHEQKRRSNELALRLYAELEQDVAEAVNPLEAAVRLAIAGNILDFGVNSSLAYTEAEQVINAALDAEFDGQALPAFADCVAQARDILYLGDNAGEVVFDRVLIERLPRDKVTFVVKGSPVINDATMADAETAGLTDLVEVITNGSDGPGTVLQTCSPQFRERFARADLIVAKGQGNYESLSEVDKSMFFILKAKCPVIARDLDCAIGEMVLRGNRTSKVNLGTSDKETTHAEL